MMMLKETMNSYLERKFEEYKNNEAIVYSEENIRLTYGEFNNRINKFAKGFISIGIKRGDHVSILAPSSPDWIVTFLALTKIGAVPVCLNDSNTLPEIKYAINHSDSCALVASTESMGNFYDDSLLDSVQHVIFLEKTYAIDEKVMDIYELLEDAETVSDETLKEYQSQTRYDDILTIQYTSGTTGKPKAVMSVHNHVLSNVLVFLKNFQYNENDRILSALPLYHVMGCLFTGLLTFMAGGTLLLIKKFRTKQVLNIMQEEKCTSFHGVPTMYQFLLNEYKNYDISNLSKGMIAGAYCSPSTMKDIQTKLGIKNIFPAYGQSEGVGFTMITMDDSDEKKQTTVGRAIEGVTLKIIDSEGNELPTGQVGEVIAYMPYRMAGYYKDEKATNDTIKDGWIYTGDLGFVDSEGYLTIKGRKKELIIRGGENISPTDIEDVIRKFASVQEIAVIGVPDDLLGEEVCAYIKVDFLNDYVKKELSDYIQLNLAKYKRPKYIRFVNSFPMTSSGKIQKNVLATMFAEEAEKEAVRVG